MKNSECIEDDSENKFCKCKKGYQFVKDDCLKEGTQVNYSLLLNEIVIKLLSNSYRI